MRILVRLVPVPDTMAGRIAATRERSMRAWIWLGGLRTACDFVAWSLPVKRAPRQTDANEIEWTGD